MSERTAVYRLIDAAGTLLYIGVAKDVGARFAGHKADKGWWPQVSDVKLTYFDTRQEALAAEREAIRAEHPLHNGVHNKKPAPVSLSRPPLTLEEAVIRLKEAVANRERSRVALWNDIRAAVAAGRSKAEIARATGLSRETIYTIINKEA